MLRMRGEREVTDERDAVRNPNRSYMSSIDLRGEASDWPAAAFDHRIAS